MKINFFSRSGTHSRGCCPPTASSLSARQWGRTSRCQFHQHFMSSFYTQRSQKHKDTDDLNIFFKLLGSAHVKAVCKHIGEIDLRWWSRTSFSPTPSCQANLRLLTIISTNQRRLPRAVSTSFQIFVNFLNMLSKVDPISGWHSILLSVTGCRTIFHAVRVNQVTQN